MLSQVIPATCFIKLKNPPKKTITEVKAGKTNLRDKATAEKQKVPSEWQI